MLELLGLRRTRALGASCRQVVAATQGASMGGHTCVCVWSVHGRARAEACASARTHVERPAGPTSGPAASSPSSGARGAPCARACAMCRAVRSSAHLWLVRRARVRRVLAVIPASARAHGRVCARVSASVSVRSLIVRACKCAHTSPSVKMCACACMRVGYSGSAGSTASPHRSIIGTCWLL